MKRGMAFILTVFFLSGIPAALPHLVFAVELPKLDLPKAEQLKKVPVTVNADKLDYDRTNDIYVAVGHVRVEQEGLRVEADKVVLNNRTGEAVAEGKVYIQDKGDIIRADKVQFNINTKAGIIYNGDLFMSKDNYHLQGEKIERKSESVYHVENGTFTTCDKSEWYLKARTIDVDMDKYATADDVSFNLSGLPVFYSPYLLFPVKRQTGLLMPELGYSSSEGFLMKNAFFWAISDYQDMTFYDDYRSRHGNGVGAEFRYVNSKDSAGKIYYNYFDTFSKYRVSGLPEGRWEFKAQHDEEIAEDLSIRADVNLVSDFAYYRDLETRLELRSPPYLDSNIFYVERWETASLYLLGQYTTDLTQTNENTVQTLPQLRYNMFEENITGPFHLNFDGSASNFTSQEGADVRRADFNPQLSAPFGVSGLTLTPRLGARATFYDRSGTNAEIAEPTEREFYYASVDLNSRISRVYGTDSETGFGRIRHSIEPTISYSYIPHIDQTGIPQVDSVDAVTAQNLVTVSLINRLTAHYKDTAGTRSFDMVVFLLSESYDFYKARSTDTTLSGEARSALHGELYVKTPKLLTFSSTTDYDTYTHVFVTTIESVAVDAGTVRFNLTHEYLHSSPTNPNTTEYLIGGIGFKAGRWDVNAQITRDIINKLTQQQDYKVHYASQCWGIAMEYINTPGNRQYKVLLDLKGLGGMKF
ncbi:MAG TPA: LPS assembly protein LptD [Nitrospirota bacterium]|nr:LPS assembly protein LptD [Nitrospirota bacterium]